MGTVAYYGYWASVISQANKPAFSLNMGNGEVANAIYC
jgi:hypothetical protein